MALKWFGESPWGPCCVAPYAEEIDPPIGEECIYCQEAIDVGDEGQMMPRGMIGTRLIESPIHRECLIRMIAGSVGHQKGRCPCHGGDEEDPPGMTKRQAAQAACQLFEDTQRKRLKHRDN